MWYGYRQFHCIQKSRSYLQRYCRRYIDVSNYELDRPLPKGENKKIILLMKDKLCRKIIGKICWIKSKNLSLDDGSEDKKAKGTKKYVIKIKVKFENYKICLEATQLDNKINYLEKIKINIDNPKKDKKEFIKNNKLILKAKQRFKNERHNVFTEEINIVALSSNDHKRMQSIDSIETYAYGTSKYLVNI